MERNNKGQFVSTVKDITGQRFSHLVALKLDHIKDRRTYWLCQCDCGNQKVVRSDCLKVIQSCGCVKKQQDILNLHIKDNHGLYEHPVYTIWWSMMHRCYYSSNPHYKDYGGRGITVCDEWKDPRNFVKWADENDFVPGHNLSIERIDVNGNYEPSNCKWIPRKEQVYNRRDTVRFVDVDGIEKSVAKEAVKRGIDPKLATTRYRKSTHDPKYIFYEGSLKDFQQFAGGKHKNDI